MGVKEGESRLNVDVPDPIRMRLDVYVAMQKKTTLKEVVAMALEMFLDEMGAQKF